MKSQNKRAIFRIAQFICLTAALLAGVFAAVATAKDQPAGYNAATIVDFVATVNSVREVAAGNPMPGIHLDAKLNNRTTDIYLAPSVFLADCGLSVSKGDEVHIVGSISKTGGVDLVLAREITLGMTTLYLRNKDGEPLWSDETSLNR